MVNEVASRLTRVLEDVALLAGLEPRTLAVRYGLPGLWRSPEEGGPQVRRSAEAITVELYNRELYSLAVEVSDRLRTSGAEHFFVRGVALLGKVYDWTDRELADVDLYVGPGASRRVVELLRALGFEGGGRETPPSRPGVTMHRGRGGSLIEEVSVDAHWGLESLASPVPQMGANVPPFVWDAVEDGDEGFPRLRDDHHVVFLIHHLLHHDLLHPRSAVDLALLWNDMDADPESMIRLAGEMRVEGMLRAFAVKLPREVGVPEVRGLLDSRGSSLSAARLRAASIREVFRQGIDLSSDRAAIMSVARLRRRAALVDGRSIGAALLARSVFPPSGYLRWRWPGAHTYWSALARHWVRLPLKVLSD